MLTTKNIFLLLTVFFLVVSLTRCTQSNTNEVETLNTQFSSYRLNKGERVKIADVSDKIDDLIAIKISNEVVEKIGSVFRFFIDLDRNVILIDKNLGNVTKVDHSGEVLWQIASDPSDFRKYNEIAEVFFDEFSGEIIVKSYDKIYTYNNSGEFVSAKQKPLFNYNQLVVIKPSEKVYSCQGQPNAHVFDEPNQLIWTIKDEIKETFITLLPFAPKNVVVGGFKEFSQLNGALYYHAPFRDTFFRIELPHVYPDFSLVFDGAIKSDEVMQNKNVRNKLKYMREERIPQILSLAADDHCLIVRYKIGYEDYFGFLDRRSAKWLVNHRYLKYGGVVVEAPQKYHNGYFLRVVPNYQVEHFAKIDPEATEVSSEWQEELERLDEAYNDTGGKTLYLIKL